MAIAINLEPRPTYTSDQLAETRQAMARNDAWWKAHLDRRGDIPGLPTRRIIYDGTKIEASGVTDPEAKDGLLDDGSPFDRNAMPDAPEITRNLIPRSMEWSLLWPQAAPQNSGSVSAEG